MSETNTEREPTEQELQAYRENMKKFYDQQIPFLKKQKEYEKRYAQGQPESARRAIQSFFADSVEPGVRKLESLNKGMLRLLEKGYMLKVVLKGHCSPLASKGYNQTLSARRIDALCNTWKISMGRQWDLYTTGSNPVLQLEILPLGEETAQIGLSDNPLDQQHSVYSLSACLERRLEIIGVEMVPPNQTR